MIYRRMRRAVAVAVVERRAEERRPEERRQLTTAQAFSEWMVCTKRASLGKEDPPSALNTFRAE